MSILMTAWAALTAVSGIADPCALVDKATAAGLLRQPVTQVMPSPPEPDEDSGGTRSSCMYFAGGRALLVIQVSFATSAAARQGVLRALASDTEKPKIVEESGVADRALWAYTEEGAQYMIVKGSHVLALSLGGAGLEPFERLHDVLKAAVIQAMAKL